MQRNKKTLSFIVPVYNEQKVIANFLDHQLFPELEKITTYKKEIILIDDGSSDGTSQILQDFSKYHKNIKVIIFSRNFGKEAALTAGLKYCNGDAAITIDCDGQQPPDKIFEFIKKWENGADVVIGVRDHFTEHGLIPKIGSKIFYKLLKKMGNQTTIPGSTDFRLLDRKVIEEYNKLTERNRIARGLIDWLGFDQKYIKYTYKNRLAGKPSYNLKKLFQLALDSFVSLSITPLILIGYIGFFITMGAFLLGLFIIIQQYILGDPLHLYWNGAVQMAVFITFLVGLVMISQAITALYISHIHAETQNRPLFIIKKKLNINEKTISKN